jgi:4-diphosphocytidyl-2-C-methyl-D-erythritol kinase
MVKQRAEHAPAKINLCLRITGRRADGYHELDSIFLPIDWSDSVALEVRPSNEPKVAIQCDHGALTDAETNLASRAAIAFMREYGIDAEVLIELQKRIPMGAGLGGGSSDAGAVLRMMTALFDLPIDDRLMQTAVKLGADVPFFLDPRPARVRGIGEIIEPLASFPRLNLVVAVPKIEVPTAKVFRALKQDDWSGPIDDSMLSRIESGEVGAADCVNDLATPAMRLFPEISELKSLLEREGARIASMSGSGSAVFGIYADEESTRRAAEHIASNSARCQVVKVIDPIHYPV